MSEASRSDAEEEALNAAFFANPVRYIDRAIRAATGRTDDRCLFCDKWPSSCTCGHEERMRLIDTTYEAAYGKQKRKTKARK